MFQRWWREMGLPLLFGQPAEPEPAPAAAAAASAFGAHTLQFQGHGGGDQSWDRLALMGALAASRRKPERGSQAAWVAALNQGYGPISRLEY
jgi:hypothetical protein